MRAVVTAALASIGHGPWPQVDELVDLDQGENLLRSVFTSVTRHDFVSKLLLPGPEPVVEYVRSMSEAMYVAAPELLIPAVTDRLPGRSEGAVFEVTTHSGCLVCA